MTTATEKSIDELMERASSALVTTDYFEAERLALKAMLRARRANDFERMARICLPLQEARRQRRHEAVDSGESFIVSALPGRDEHLRPGCYVVEPPLVGIEGRAIRERAGRRRIPVIVLVREPITLAGKWPIVGVGMGEWEPVVIRIQVDPPSDPLMPDATWVLASIEALGDAAIAKVNSAWPADHRVDDLVEWLDAVPEHEKLHQALASECAAAAKSPPSTHPRRRPSIEDPFGF